MTDTYTHVGKQVMHNGEHFSDAATVEAAQVIVEAMAER